jgi:hypothetical protein
MNFAEAKLRPWRQKHERFELQQFPPIAFWKLLSLLLAFADNPHALPSAKLLVTYIGTID